MGFIRLFWLFHSTWGAKSGCGVSILRRVLKKEKKKRITKFEYFFTNLFSYTLSPKPNPFSTSTNIFIYMFYYMCIIVKESWNVELVLVSIRPNKPFNNPNTKSNLYFGLWCIIFCCTFFIKLKNSQLKFEKKDFHKTQLKFIQLAFCERFRY